jgi:hypothetical protein
VILVDISAALGYGLGYHPAAYFCKELRGVQNRGIHHRHLMIYRVNSVGCYLNVNPTLSAIYLSFLSANVRVIQVFSHSQGKEGLAVSALGC